MTRPETVDALTALGTFSEVPPDLLEEKSSSARIVDFQPGDSVIDEGADTNDAFVLVSGKLKVSRQVRGIDYLLAEIEEPGTVIGEAAVLTGGRRSATVRAELPSRLIKLRVAAFEDLLAHAPTLAARITHEALARIETTELQTFLARHLGTDDSATLSEVARSASWHRVPGGEVLFAAGDAADSAYAIVSGRVGLTDPVTGHLVELGRGALIGELGVIGTVRQSVTAQTLRDSVLVRFPAETIDAVMERRPKLMLEVARMTMLRVRHPARPTPGAMVIAVAVVGDLDRRQILPGLANHLSALGLTTYLGPDRAESLLARPGASQAEVGELAEVRLVALLHELELSCSYLLLEADGAGRSWSSRCLRQADRVVVIAAASLSKADVEAARELMSQTNSFAERLLVVAHSAQTTIARGSAELANEIGAGRVVNVHLDSEDELGRVARVVTGRAYGLVFGGGGARGFAHIGVYKATSELGIPIDWVGGSSIGSIFAALVALDLSPDSIEELSEKLFRGVLDYTLPVVSLVKGTRITANIESVVGDADIEDLWRNFFCVSTNLTRSSSQVHFHGSLARSLRASVAIPGVIPPVPWGDDLLVDGGVMDNLPVGTMRAIQPHSTIIAVDLAPSLGPRAKSDYGLSVSGWRALAARTRHSPLSYPSIAAVLMRSMIISSESQRPSKRAESDLYIELDLRGVGILDFDTVRPVAQAGYEQSMPLLEDWIRTRNRA